MLKYFLFVGVISLLKEVLNIPLHIMSDRTVVWTEKN